jgi:putative transposase
MAAVCYVDLNPVRARLVSRAEDWPWSGALAHLAGVDDNLVTVRPVLDRTSCFADLLLQDRPEVFAALRRSEGSGRPVGSAEFVTGLERLLGRPISRRAPGPKPANRVDGEQLELPQ